MSEVACTKAQLVKPVKKTAFNKVHHDLGARMATFAGWELPVWYTSALEEHHTVRAGGGIFDVSHMGRVRLIGEKAGIFLNKVLTKAAERMALGTGQLCLLLLENGSILDDLFVYRLGPNRYQIVWNACNVDYKLGWLLRWSGSDPDLIIEDVTNDTVMLAVQGPATSQLEGLKSVSRLSRFAFIETEIGGVRVLAARTGYTGEDGFEIVSDAANALPLWKFFIEQGVRPCGLGARDSLRLEAGMLLYGQDIDKNTNPFEAGLGWLVDFKGSEFIGSSALLEIKRRGIKRRLVGFQMKGRGIARSGYRILKAGQEVGIVTSGSYAPTLGINIGLGYVPFEIATIGTDLDIMIRDKPVAAEIVSRRFYRKRA